MGREEPVSLAPSKSTRIAEYTPQFFARALFSEDEYLYPGQPFFLASMFRKGSASGQPPMAYFQKSTDLGSDELHKVPEILIRHFHPHCAIGPAFFRGSHVMIVVGGLENSAYGAYRKRQYQRRIAWRQNDVIK
ncbi:MAG TPA: hypothetical protein VN754_11605, partial [Candidatus Binataceae bacterium]|nr:hypothetical protein [Candidatus Binataceae bacterium]